MMITYFTFTLANSGFAVIYFGKRNKLKGTVLATLYEKSKDLVEIRKKYEQK